MQNIAEILERFQSYLDQCDIPQQPSGLYEPMRYALSLGGKRMRPLLMILAYGRFRRLFWCLMPVFLTLCCSTVYIQAHYFIDVIGGLVSAFLFYHLSQQLYKWLSPRSAD